jgi:hypothetical protein
MLPLPSSAAIATWLFCAALIRVLCKGRRRKHIEIGNAEVIKRQVAEERLIHR